MADLYIGGVAARTGLTRGTIRYYESIGLLESGPRTASGYRVYNHSTLVELDFVRRAQGLGFSLDEIREFLRLRRRGLSPCERLVSVAKRRLAAIEQQLVELMAFRDQLSRSVSVWTTCDLAGPCALIDRADECQACESAEPRVSKQSLRSQALPHDHGRKRTGGREFDRGLDKGRRR